MIQRVIDFKMSILILLVICNNNKTISIGQKTTDIILIIKCTKIRQVQ